MDGYPYRRMDRPRSSMRIAVRGRPPPRSARGRMGPGQMHWRLAEETGSPGNAGRQPIWETGGPETGGPARRDTGGIKASVSDWPTPPSGRPTALAHATRGIKARVSNWPTPPTRPAGPPQRPSYPQHSSAPRTQKGRSAPAAQPRRFSGRARLPHGLAARIARGAFSEVTRPSAVMLSDGGQVSACAGRRRGGALAGAGGAVSRGQVRRASVLRPGRRM